MVRREWWLALPWIRDLSAIMGPLLTYLRWAA
jgi:hypothetical protein